MEDRRYVAKRMLSIQVIDRADKVNGLTELTAGRQAEATTSSL